MKFRSVIAVAFLSGLALAQKPLSDDTVVAAGYVRQLRNQMRDPDSFVLEKVFTHIIPPLTKEQTKRMGKKEAAKWTATRVGSTQFCFEYRGRNGFGGMNREVASTADIEGAVNHEPFVNSCAELWPDIKDITADVMAVRP
jgi:hypothetical protein